MKTGNGLFCALAAVALFLLPAGKNPAQVREAAVHRPPRARPAIQAVSRAGSPEAFRETASGAPAAFQAVSPAIDREARSEDHQEASVSVQALVSPGAFPHTLPAEENLVPDASYYGIYEVERAGYCLSGGGDVNGDGYRDFVIGNYHSQPRGQYNSGSVYLLLGKSGPLQLNQSLSHADARFIGKYAYDAFGYSAWCSGDVNGDGYDDIVIGACAGNTDYSQSPGRAFIIFGKASPDWGSSFIAEDDADVRFVGLAPGDRLGAAVTVIPDMNGDGCDEVLLGVPNEGSGDYGKAYLFKGRRTWSIYEIPVNHADAVFIGAIAEGWVGASMTGLGDVNGDHIPDFLIGAHKCGNVYLIFGRAAMDWGSYSLSQIEVTVISEEFLSSFTGFQVRTAGDVNGDGLTDFLIGAPGQPGIPERLRGKAYLILGKTGAWYDFSLASADASYIGESASDQAGWGLAGNFDFDSDGFDDFVIGAPYNNQAGYEAGKLYLIHGGPSGWTRNVQLSAVTDYFLGEHGGNPSSNPVIEGDQAGFAATECGDFNGDGADDFAMSAVYNSEAIHWGGKDYLFLGDISTAEISGRVLYDGQTDAPVEDVDMRVNAGSGYGQTASDGTYSLILDKGQSYIVTPVKPPGQDMNDAVTNYDAALIARHVVGLEALGAGGQARGDVNGDGSLTLSDAVGVSRFSVGLTNLAGFHTGEWVMDPENRSYALLSRNQAEQDYTASLMGDTDGGWEPPVTGKAAGQGPIESGRLGQCAAIAKGTLFIPLEIHGGTGVISYDLELTYDTDSYAWEGSYETALSAGFCKSECEYRGKVRMGAFRSAPVRGEGVLCVLKFRIKSSPQGTGRGAITMERFRINNGPAERSRYVHSESGNEPQVPSEWWVSPNYPNPFNLSTGFQVFLPEAARVKIECYDALGRRIRQLDDREYEPGIHIFSWDGTADGVPVESGVYFIMVRYGERVCTMKAVLLK